MIHLHHFHRASPWSIRSHSRHLTADPKFKYMPIVDEEWLSPQWSESDERRFGTGTFKGWTKK